jgi:hypothetical protein
MAALKLILVLVKYLIYIFRCSKSKKRRRSVKKVRSISRYQKGFKEVYIIERKKNIGPCK